MNIVALFFADDGLLLAENLKDATDMINFVVQSAAKCGLSLSKQKSKILLFNVLDQTTDKEGIEVVDTIKYLGVTVTNKRDCFSEHKRQNIDKARKFANLLYSVVSRSCNRMLIGKTYWKCLAMSSFLYAAEAMLFSEEEIPKHQRIENQVYRNILQLPTYVASGGLRSEIGASSCRARDMKEKILFVKHIMKDNGNALLRRIFMHRFENNEGEYTALVKRYMEAVGLTLNEVKCKSDDSLKKLVNGWDSVRWRAEITEKETLRIYRKYKTDIKEEKWYDNTWQSNVMMKGRFNVLPLNWRKRHQGGSVLCPICNEEDETQEHFLIHCKAYADLKRDYNFINGGANDEDDTMARMLLLKEESDEIEKKKELLQRMFNRRTAAQKTREREGRR